MVIPKIKYVITLDGDTILPLNTGLQLVGTMMHILKQTSYKKWNCSRRVWSYTTENWNRLKQCK